MRIIIAERFTAEAGRLASLVVPLDAVRPDDRAGLQVLLRWPAGGEARALRPEPGTPGSTIGFALAHGDLVVMGGSCQRTWQHAIPKSTTFARPSTPTSRPSR